MHSNFWKYGAAALIASALVMTPRFHRETARATAREKANKHDEGDDEGKHKKYELATMTGKVITQYYSNRGIEFAAGLGKARRNLPPGLEKQLERNGHASAGPAKARSAVPGGT